jgi:hypothetical protein
MIYGDHGSGWLHAAVARRRESQPHPEHLGGLAGHYVQHVGVISGYRDLRAKDNNGLVSQAQLVPQPEDITVGVGVGHQSAQLWRERERARPRGGSWTMVVWSITCMERGGVDVVREHVQNTGAAGVDAAADEAELARALAQRRREDESNEWVGVPEVRADLRVRREEEKEEHWHAMSLRSGIPAWQSRVGWL